MYKGFGKFYNQHRTSYTKLTSWSGRIRLHRNKRGHPAPVGFSRLNKSIGENTKRVYVVVVSLKQKPDRKFIKVGVSGYLIEERFQLDLNTYDFFLMAASDWVSNEQAFALEHAIHSGGLYDKYLPAPLLASGGNTECYQYSES